MRTLSLIVLMVIAVIIVFSFMLLAGLNGPGVFGEILANSAKPGSLEFDQYRQMHGVASVTLFFGSMICAIFAIRSLFRQRK